MGRRTPVLVHVTIRTAAQKTQESSSSVRRLRQGQAHRPTDAEPRFPHKQRLYGAPQAAGVFSSCREEAPEQMPPLPASSQRCQREERPRRRRRGNPEGLRLRGGERCLPPKWGDKNRVKTDLLSSHSARGGFFSLWFYWGGGVCAYSCLPAPPVQPPLQGVTRCRAQPGLLSVWENITEIKCSQLPESGTSCCI